MASEVQVTKVTGGYPRHPYRDLAATAEKNALLVENQAETATPKYAYVFLHYDEHWPSYSNDTIEYSTQCGTLISVAATIEARRKNHMNHSSVDLVVMHASDLSTFLKKRLSQLGVKTVQISTPATKGDHRYYTSFEKLRAAQLFQYRRVIFLEMDYMMMRSLDHYFEVFGDIPIAYAAPKMYWVAQTGYTQAGPYLADPTKLHWEKFFKNVMDEHSAWGYPGDNDFTNMRFKKEQPVLPGFLSLLVGEWIPGDGIEQFWGKYYDWTPQRVYEHAYGVHFIADNKPWKQNPSFWTESEYKQLDAVYKKWWDLQRRVCTRTELTL